MACRVVVPLLVLALAGPVVFARQTFYARTDLVHVPVIVTGRDGRPVSGLTAGDFEVREDGRAQQIQFFAAGPVGGALPLHLGLLLDTSESMQSDLPDAARASIQFVNAVEESIDATLVDFDTVVRVGRFEPPSYPQLFERIRARTASGMTALYDAIAVFLSGAAARPGQHVLVLYTDGGDSNSTVTFGRVIDMVRLAGNVIVYAIGYLENQGSLVRVEQQMRLTQLARESGGDAYFPTSAKQMAGIYDRIRAELSARYTLGYVPTNPSADGRFRKLRVSLRRTAGNGTTIRARTGYYGPRK